MNRIGLAVALASVTGVALADPPSRALPAAPWPVIDSMALPGTGVTAPLLLPDGRLAVFTQAPPAFALVDPDSGNVRSSTLHEPPLDGRARIDSLGRLAVQVDGWTLFRVGLDGGLRAAVPLPAMIRGIVERPDGTEVATIESNQRVDFVTFRADGSVLAARALAASTTSRPTLLYDGRVAVGVPFGLAVLDRTGAIQLVPGLDEVLHLVRLGDATVAVTATSFSTLDRDLLPSPPTPLPGRTRWWTARPDGGALLWIDGTTPTLLTLDRRGVIVGRITTPPAIESVSVDDSGALLLVNNLNGRGHLVALEPDGRTRWTVDLPHAIVPEVTLGPRGEAWVTCRDTNVLRLSSRPASAQEAPRAHR